MASRRKIQMYDDVFAPKIAKQELATNKIDRQMRAQQKRGGFQQQNMFQTQEGESTATPKNDFKFKGGRRKKKLDFSNVKRNEEFKAPPPPQPFQSQKQNPPRSFPKRQVYSPKSWPGKPQASRNAYLVKTLDSTQDRRPTSGRDQPVAQLNSESATPPPPDIPSTTPDQTGPKDELHDLETQLAKLQDEQKTEAEKENFPRCISIRKEIGEIEEKLKVLRSSPVQYGKPAASVPTKPKDSIHESEQQPDPNSEIASLNCRIEVLKIEQQKEAKKENFTRCIQIRTEMLELEAKVAKLQETDATNQRQQTSPNTPGPPSPDKQTHPTPSRPPPPTPSQEQPLAPSRAPPPTPSRPPPSTPPQSPESKVIRDPHQKAPDSGTQVGVVRQKPQPQQHARTPSRLNVVRPNSAKYKPPPLQIVPGLAQSKESDRLKLQLQVAEDKCTKLSNRDSQMQTLIRQLEEENSILQEKTESLEQEIDDTKTNLHQREQSMAGKLNISHRKQESLIGHLAEKDQRERKISGIVETLSDQTKIILAEQQERHAKEMEDLESHYKRQFAEVQTKSESTPMPYGHEGAQDWQCQNCGTENHAGLSSCAACRHPVMANAEPDKNVFKEKLAAQLAGGMMGGMPATRQNHPKIGGHDTYQQSEDEDHIAELEQQLQEALSFCAKQKKSIEEQANRIKALEQHLSEATQGQLANNGQHEHEELLKGILMKRDPHGPRVLRGWKKRFCILDSRSFRYFDKAEDDVPKGEIFISSIVTVERAVSDRLRHTFVVSIRETDRIYEFKAESSDQCGNWVTMIKNQLF